MSVRTISAMLAAALGMVCVTAAAQDRPSWRTETPEKPEAPPEMERPDFEFNIDRSDLFKPEGMPADDPESDPVEAQAALSAPPALEDSTLEPVAVDSEPVPVEVEPVNAQTEPVDAPPEPVTEVPEAFDVVPEEEQEQFAALSPVPDPVEEIAAPIETAEPPASDFVLKRTRAVAPDYPRHAWLNNQEGWVDLMLTVDPSGRVQDVEIVDAEPRRVFEKSALRAAMKWRFDPPEDYGIHSPQRGKFRITFTMEG